MMQVPSRDALTPSRTSAASRTVVTKRILAETPIIDKYLIIESQKSKNSIQSILTDTTVSFAFITDLHYKDAYPIDNTLATLANLSSLVDISFVVLGGDNIQERVKTTRVTNGAQLRSKFEGLTYFPVLGNHDDNSIYDVSYLHAVTSTNYLDGDELYAEMFDHVGALGAIEDVDNKKSYYYYDDMVSKIRFIFVNSIDIPYILDDGLLRYNGQWNYGFSNAQLNFIANALLLDTGWAALLIGHIPPVINDFRTTEQEMANRQVLIDIMKAYKSGTPYTSTPTEGDFAQSVTIDYTEQGAGELIGFLCGHIHRDAMYEFDGIKYYFSANAQFQQIYPMAPERVADTASEILFDVVTIDRSEREIYFTRVGAGKDRQYTY